MLYMSYKITSLSVQEANRATCIFPQAAAAALCKLSQRCPSEHSTTTAPVNLSKQWPKARDLYHFNSWYNTWARNLYHLSADQSPNLTTKGQNNHIVCHNCNSRIGVLKLFSRTAQLQTCPQGRTPPPPGSRRISAHASLSLLWLSPPHLHIPKTPERLMNQSVYIFQMLLE